MNLTSLEQTIIDYLAQFGPALCLVIGADINRKPWKVQAALWRLQDRGVTEYLGCTIYHQLCADIEA